jgi:hypothetical protein
MPSRRRHALVCELHAHTRPVRDGSVALPELVDLYGDAGFDVLCITDHVVAGDEHVHAANHAAYLAAIDAQAVRARERYGLQLFNRHELFGWVADARLPAVASGDAHEVEHLHTWKTALPCEQHPEAVVEYLRSRRPAFLVPAPAGASLVRARPS